MHLRRDTELTQDIIEAPRLLAALEWALAGATAAYQAFIAPHLIWGDGSGRFDTLVQLFHRGHVTSTRYSILHEFFAAPLYLLGEIFGHGAEFTAYFNVLVFDFTLVLLYRLLRRHVSATILRRTILLLLAASMFGYHVQTFYGEVLSACGAILGFAALAIDRPGIAGVAMCVSVVNTPAALLGLVLCNGLWALRKRRWFHAAWPVLLSAGLIGLEFWWRRGSPTRSGYAGDSGFKNVMPYSGLKGFSYPLPLGLLSLLFSFGKGILFFAPGLLLCHVVAPGQRDPIVRSLVKLGLAFSWGLLLVYSPWWAWNGALYWGPRFLLVACAPASLALAIHVSNKERRPTVTALTALAVAWSGWVSINGTVFRDAEVDICMANDFNLEPLCWYTPEYSPLIYPFIQAKPLTSWDKAGVYLGIAVVLIVVVPMLARRIRDFAIESTFRVR